MTDPLPLFVDEACELLEQMPLFYHKYSQRELAVKLQNNYIRVGLKMGQEGTAV